MEVADEAGAAQQAAELLRALNLRSAVIAQGITTDSASVAARLLAMDTKSPASARMMGTRSLISSNACP